MLRKKIFIHRCRRQKRPASQTPFSFEQADSLGVLFTWQDKAKEEEVIRFIGAVNPGRRVDCLCFNPNKKQEIDTHFPVFSLNDLSIWGKIKSEATNRFIEQPFNCLFHLDLELNEVCQALLSGSQAQHRVGLYAEASEKFYELMIGINKNEGFHNFTDQILRACLNFKEVSRC